MVKVKHYLQSIPVLLTSVFRMTYIRPFLAPGWTPGITRCCLKGNELHGNSTSGVEQSEKSN